MNADELAELDRLTSDPGPRWRDVARDEQLRPDGVSHFALIGGRGSGKTRAGAEDFLERVRAGVKRLHIIAPTFADTRDVCVEGESGILACARPGEVLNWNRSMGEITFRGGARAKCFASCEPDRLNGPQCFIAGTQVSTTQGAVPIESVGVGDCVITRNGPRRVVRTANRLSQVGLVKFNNGSQLIGTADHPVYSISGWTRMDRLQEGGLVCAINALNGAVSGGTVTAAATTNTGAQGQRAGRTGTVCTVRYGVHPTGQCLPGSTFTTSTEIRRTTLSKTCNYSASRNTAHTTPKIGPFRSRYSWLTRFNARNAASLLRGSVRSWFSAASRADTATLKKSARKSESACSAARSSSQGRATTAVSVASTWQPAGEQCVYCLTVEKDHEYFANGILVHNCGHLWADEFGLYGDTNAIDMALFGLRLGDEVTSCWTSTPKMTKSTRYVLALANLRVRRMRTRDNYANLAKGVVDQLEAKYSGTRLGRQELEGEILEDVEGSLWQKSWFDIPGFRLPAAIYKQDGKRKFSPPAQVIKIVVALDPTVSDKEKSKNPHKEPDACGIIVAGLGSDARGYVLADMTAILPPAEWARLAVGLYDFTKASGIIAEANQGGELIREVIRGISPNVPVQLVHASMAKRPRAEPVAILYEQGRVSHCGEFRDLEDQQLSWDASDPSVKSPNNVDALVWAFHGLGLCTATGLRKSQGIVKGG